MAGTPNEQVLFQGAVYDKKTIESHKFPISCKFKYTNASYNDEFLVVSIRKDPGAEYRQIVGKIAGEVWMLLSSLQKEVAAGAITFIQPPVETVKSVTTENKKTAKKKKAKKS